MQICRAKASLFACNFPKRSSQREAIHYPKRSDGLLKAKGKCAVTPKELRDFRKGKKLMQADLAAMLGVSRKTIVNWEGGMFAVPSDIMDRLTIAGVLDAAPAVGKLTATDKAAIAQYNTMRAQPGDVGTHAFIMSFWQKHNFTPSQAVQDAIASAFPDATS